MIVKVFNFFSLKNVFPLLLLVFLLVFPKGGFKISEIPLTWGYLLLGLAAGSFFFRRIHGILHSHLQVFLALIPFQLVALAHFCIYGINDWGFGFSFLVHFSLFPLFFFFIFSKSISAMNLSPFFEYLKHGIFLIALYGIFLFFFVHIFGFFLTIPFLTVNWNDLGILETTKCIMRGDFFKLISTYNNGNIYGICVLILLPLYIYLEKKTWKQRVVKLSLILTLSRTVWVGLVVVELFRILYIQKINEQKNLVVKTITFISLLSAIIFLLGKDFSFIFDPTLGGRSAQLHSLEGFYWTGRAPFNSLSEMVYVSVYKNFGIMGLVTFIFGITSPLWSYSFFQRERSTLQKAMIAGLSTYLILSCADGAILFIPVMAFYWFLSALLLTAPSPLTTRP